MPEVFTLREEVDFIAIAPVVLGFQPQESLVMITMNAFHARIDIPDVDEVTGCITALLAPCKRHNVEQVAFVLFDSGDHNELKTELVDAFAVADIKVITALEVRGNQWRRFDSYEWTDYDFAAAPLTLEAQFRGHAPKHASRAEMAAQIKPQGSGLDDYQLTVMRRLHDDGTQETIESLTRETAREAVELWSGILRGCEPDTNAAADAAIVLAFASWLAGDGAKAWAALDLADRTSPWSAVMAGVLTKAVNPSVWPDDVES